MSNSAEERYLEWLERLEVPIENTTDLATFQSWLGEQMEASENQIAALWGAVQDKYENYIPEGVTAIQVEYSWGTQTRYTISGMQGLFGWAEVQKIRSVEGGT